MIQTATKPVTFEEFLDWKPENGRYELHNGGIVEMSQPLGGHEKVIGFSARKLTVEFDRLNLPYFIPKQAVVKPPENESAYSPDVLILNRPNLASEPGASQLCNEYLYSGIKYERIGQNKEK